MNNKARGMSHIIAYLLIGAALGAIAALLASCATLGARMITGKDLQAYYGAPHIAQSHSNGKGEWWYFHLKDDGTDAYWIVNDTIKGYDFH